MANQDTTSIYTDTDPFDRPLPKSVETWSILVDSKEINYGQVHDMMHRDISIGNDYRKERIKHLTTLATGVFALTITFHKDFFGAKLTGIGLTLMLLGWVMLIVSLLAGIVHFRKWEDFYLEHREQGSALWRYRTASSSADRKKARVAFHKACKRIEDLRSSYGFWNLVQSGGLLLGMVFIASYVGIMGYTKILDSSSADNQTMSYLPTRTPKLP